MPKVKLKIEIDALDEKYCGKCHKRWMNECRLIESHIEFLEMDSTGKYLRTTYCLAAEMKE